MPDEPPVITMVFGVDLSVLRLAAFGSKSAMVDNEAQVSLCMKGFCGDRGPNDCTCRGLDYRALTESYGIGKMYGEEINKLRERLHYGYSQLYAFRHVYLG
jgi:hypothetical protein